MIAAIESQDLAIILGAVGVIWAPLVGGLVTINRQAKQINKAVNNRPAGEPTIYDRVAAVEVAVAFAADAAKDVKSRLENQDRVDTKRHMENQASIAEVAKSVRALSARVSRIEHPPSAGKRSNS